MNEEKELFLPDTTVKLGTLRRVLNDIYGLDIIKLKMTDTRIASEIVNQLGGMGRLNMMTGAYNFGALPNGVTFRIKNQKANVIKITLTSMDLYNLEVGRLRGGKYTVVVEKLGLYNDMLKPAIEKATGMYLSMKHGGNTTEQTDIMHFEGLHLYETENGYGIDNRGLVYEYKPKDKASLQQATKHFERVKNLIMKSRYAKGSTIRASNSPVLEFVNFEDNWHINLLKLNPNRNQNGLLYKGGNKYAVIRSGNKDKQELFEFKTLEEAEDKFDKLVTESTTYSPIRNQGKIEGNYANGGGVGKLKVGDIVVGYKYDTLKNKYVKGLVKGEVLEITPNSARVKYFNPDGTTHTQKEHLNNLKKYADGGGVGGTFDSSSTGEVLGGTYGSSESGEMIGGTMASSMYKNGGAVGEDFSVWKLSKSGVVKLKTGTMTALNRFLNKEKSLQNKGLASIFDGKSGVVTFPSNVTQNEVIKYNNSMGNGSATSQEYANGGGVGDEISIATKYGKMLNEISKEKQFNKKIELNSQLNQFAKQNEISIDHNNIIYIKGNKVAYIDTLNSKTGQSKINWVIKKYANGGGIGGTSDSAEMDAPTLGGTMSSSMFEGDTYSNRFENKLWNEIADGTPHSFKKGGKVSDCGCKEKYDEGGNAECGCWHYDIGGL